MSATRAGAQVAAIILAAGAGSRMGRLKQVLPYKRGTLISHAVSEALEAGFDPVIVVVGAESGAVRSALAEQPVSIVENPSWGKGMGSSVAAGVRYLQEQTGDSAAVAILLADQPLVKAAHLAALKDLFSRSGATVVAAYYNDTLGVPAIFDRSLFPVLIALPPEAGARSLLRDPRMPVTVFDLPEAAVDIDTPGDFAALPPTV